MVRVMTHALASIPPAVADERRRARRVPCLIPVELQADGLSQIAKLVEISRSGGRLRTALPLAPGQKVTVARGSVTLSGRVAWVRDETAGLRFTRPMQETDFLALRRGNARVVR